MWMSKKHLKQENEYLKYQLENSQATYNELAENYETIVSHNNELADMVEVYMEKYPLELGQTVYDVQLRSALGRYTKTKAVFEFSSIKEVVVDKKNYFRLVERYAANEVFIDRVEAERYLESVCVAG